MRCLGKGTELGNQCFNSGVVNVTAAAAMVQEKLMIPDVNLVPEAAK
jgi:hypothetical protein